MLTFSVHGAQLFSPGLTVLEQERVRATLARLPTDKPGLRLRGIEELRPFLVAGGSIGKIAACALGGKCRPVRAILFEKTEAKNWALGWHQDRTIAVKRRMAVSGYDIWTLKDGMTHVEPPFDLLAAMVTLRVHFDPVTESNAPLLIAPGSHKLGRISDGDIAEAVKECGVFVCQANAGDVWLYATPILHASKAASNPSHRRVLQVDYSALDLPSGLEWLGV